MATTEDYSPRFVGDTDTDLLCSFVDGEGNPYVLTGVNVSDMKLHIKPAGGTTRDGAGTWAIIDAVQGQASYTWDTTDVNGAGIFQIQATLIKSGKSKHFEIKEIAFLNPL